MQLRSSNGTAAPAPTRPAVWLLLLALGLAAVVFWVAHPGSWKGWWLEDIPVYSHALNAFLAGNTPYNASMAPLYFLYPPFFLYLGGAFAHVLPPHWGPFAYIGVHLVATCALPLVLARYFFRQVWLSPLLALLIFFAAPRFMGMDALFMANIATLLYCLAFAAAVPGLKRNRWEWFYLAVTLAAMIKITFLALLLLPLLVGRKQWLRSIACGAVVVAGNLAERALLPDLYGGYQWSLKQGILTEGSFGFGVFGILARILHKRSGILSYAPYAISLLLAVGIIALLFALRTRLEKLDSVVAPLAANARWLALVLIAVILVNPRELQYDVDIALFAAFVVWVSVLRVKRPLLLLLGLFAPSLVVEHVMTNPHLYNAYSTLLVLAAFAAGYWKLWHGTDELSTPMAA